MLAAPPISHLEETILSTSKSYRLVSALFAIILLVLTASVASAQPNRTSIKIYLRRATFDPLSALPSIASTLQADATSRLLLAQFDSEPTAEIRQALVAAGAQPLLYIPDNALVVRLDGTHAAALPALPGLRWYGSFAPAYKLAADLDPMLSNQDAGMLDLRLLAADGDIDLLMGDLGRVGGMVLGRSAGLNGVALRVRLPANALRQIVRRDDVLWVERFIAPRVQNDQVRKILGVTAARQQLGWLDGAGQIVAVTDTGLDVEASVLADTNADFPASQIAAAFSPAQVDTSCASNADAATWSDRNGHGTHVAGTVLGSGANSPSGFSFAGIAPKANLIVQGVETSAGVAEGTLDCLAFDNTFLEQAYGAGARVQNASWGAPTGVNSYGGYTQFSSNVDEFLWQHKDHLLVVAAGNDGVDNNPRDGVIDADSIDQPATAKNVLTVGASENNRPPTLTSCGFNASSPQNLCWNSYVFSISPISDDFVSNNINGIAAFSSRGPTDDGRIKPEIVAPGTNIISAASQDPNASYDFVYPGGLYAYDSGTSMATPMLSGMAALVRQWLAQSRQIAAPSAALIKALLLSGATNLGSGQYGTGAAREIPANWPNNVEGWGRAALLDTVGLSGAEVWLADNTTGLSAPGATATYALIVSAGQPLRLTLAWTDYPGSPNAGKALVNDLDLEVQTPDGALVHGNAAAVLKSDCRDTQTGADRCNNVESVEIAAPVAGLYTVRVRAAALPSQLAQPFALVGRAKTITDHPLDPPALQPIPGGGGPTVKLSWNAIESATFYTIEQGATSNFATISNTYTVSAPSMTIVQDIGTYWFRVRACTLGSCSLPSNARSVTVLTPPEKSFLPLITR